MFTRPARSAGVKAADDDEAKSKRVEVVRFAGSGARLGSLGGLDY